jgi:hypothetical protein
MKFFAFLLLLLPIVSNAAQANYLMIKYMQPKEAFEERLDNVDGLAQYIKQIEVDINKKIAEASSMPTWGFLVIAVRGDGKIKAWMDTDAEVSPEIAKAMIDVAQKTKGFTVNKGAVVFSIGFDIGDVGLPPYTMPFPNEWKKVATCTNEDCQDKDIEAIVLKSW